MDLDFHEVLLTPSDLLEHLFCGRFTYFERHLGFPEYQERREKVLRGRELHAVREATNRAYLRKRLGVVDKKIDVSLISRRHHLRGRLDEVLFFDDGTAGPLDYKFAKDPGRIYKTLRLQSAIYALLIGENFGVPVRRGYLVYTRSQNRVVEITYRTGGLPADRAGGAGDSRRTPSRNAPPAGTGLPLRRLLLPIYLRLRGRSSQVQRRPCHTSSPSMQSRAENPPVRPPTDRSSGVICPSICIASCQYDMV